MILELQSAAISCYRSTNVVDKTSKRIIYHIKIGWVKCEVDEIAKLTPADERFQWIRDTCIRFDHQLLEVL